MNNLLTAITTKITTGPSALSSDVGGRVFLDEYPSDEMPPTFPYIIFFVVSAVPENVFNKAGESIIIQFSLFSASEGAAEITDMYADLKALFDDAQLTVTSSTMIIMRRENLVTTMKDVTVNNAAQIVRHWEVDYSIELQAS